MSAEGRLVTLDLDPGINRAQRGRDDAGTACRVEMVLDDREFGVRSVRMAPSFGIFRQFPRDLIDFLLHFSHS